MSILEFLQKKGKSRRNVLELLENWFITKNWETISYRKELIEQWEIIEISTWDKEKEVFYVESTKEEKTKIILFNKPLGYVVSKKDPHNQTIYEILPPERENVYTPIGRLDKDSHWLLILTNQKKIISEYSHPRHQHTKTYIVYTKSPLKESDIKKTKKGVEYFDKDTKRTELLQFDDCTPIKSPTVISNSRYAYKILLHSWKKRHIRRCIETLNNQVVDLKRISFGERQLPENLQTGDWKIV